MARPWRVPNQAGYWRRRHGGGFRSRTGTPGRIVALKVIKLGFANAELLRRFERESEVLARLQHPGIAQIYEAGAADTGFGPQPYFAMDFIHSCTGANRRIRAAARHLQRCIEKLRRAR
jgi:serine/threonine protein kinase